MKGSFMHQGDSLLAGFLTTHTEPLDLQMHTGTGCRWSRECSQFFNFLLAYVHSLYAHCMHMSYNIGKVTASRMESQTPKATWYINYMITDLCNVGIPNTSRRSILNEPRKPVAEIICIWKLAWHTMGVFVLPGFFENLEQLEGQLAAIRRGPVNSHLPRQGINEVTHFFLELEASYLFNYLPAVTCNPTLHSWKTSLISLLPCYDKCNVYN